MIINQLSIQMKYLLILLLFSIASCDIKTKDTLKATEINTIGEPQIEFNLLTVVLNKLHLKKENCKLDLVVLKENPANTNETIVVIPEIVEEAEDYFELNSHILVVASKTGTIKYRYFESSETNEWYSDAVRLVEIAIDTAPYHVTSESRAFGIKVRYLGSSQPNPYENETISLFIQKNESLERILKNVTIREYGGEWDTDCAGEFVEQNSIIIMSENTTNGYYDIQIKTTTSKSIAFLNQANECDEKETISKQNEVLKYDDVQYNSSLSFAKR